MFQIFEISGVVLEYFYSLPVGILDLKISIFLEIWNLSFTLALKKILNFEIKNKTKSLVCVERKDAGEMTQWLGECSVLNNLSSDAVPTSNGSQLLLTPAPGVQCPFLATHTKIVLSFGLQIFRLKIHNPIRHYTWREKKGLPSFVFFLNLSFILRQSLPM